MIAALMATLFPASLRAATVTTADGRTLTGKLDAVTTDAVRLKLEDKNGAPRTENIPLADVVLLTIKDAPIIPVGVPGGLIVENDGVHTMRDKSGTVGLKAGKHEISILYFQHKDARGLRLSWSGPNLSRRPIPETVFFHLPPDTAVPAASLAQDGLRNAQNSADMKPQLEYSYYENNTGVPWVTSADMLAGQPKTTGFASRVDLSLAERSDDFGMLFHGFIEVPADGQYTFYLSTDDGSQLHIGPPPPPPTRVAATPAADVPWIITLPGRDRVSGTIQSWGDKKLTVAPAAAPQSRVDIATAELVELWRPNVDRSKIPDLSKLGGDPADIALVSHEAQIKAVTGIVTGITDNSLVFRYEGQDRKIAIDRLVGVIFAKRPPTPAPDMLRLSMLLNTGDVLTGQWTAVDGETVKFKPAWSSAVTLPLDRVLSVRALNGRLVYLSDLDPARVDQTPFFDRVAPWRRDTTLSGTRIKLGPASYDRGVAMPSRTVLVYDLAGGYERFKAVVGFEEGLGKLGRTTLRVVGDDKVLFESLDAKGEAPPQNVDVDLRGVKRFAIEVDFGEGQDVGDRVIWADARLIRAAKP